MFPLSLFNLDLTTVEGWIRSGGLFVLFALLCACGLGLPLPEDIPLITAGYLVAKGQMNLALACVFAWCGIMCGDLLLYHLGKKFGLEITRVPFVGKHVTKARIERLERLFVKYGVWVVAVARLVAGVRGAMVVAAGAIRYNLLVFIIADGLAAVVSGGLWLWLGHWLGKKFDIAQMVSRTHTAERWFTLIAVALVFLLVVWIMIHRDKKRSEEGSGPPPPPAAPPPSAG